MSFLFELRKFRSLHIVLATLLVYVVSVQCCQRNISALFSSGTTMACHGTTTLPQKNNTNDASQENTLVCHCEYSPAQLAWDHYDKTDLSDLEPRLLLYSLLSTHHLKAVEVNPNTRHLAARAPPSEIPVFITSTVLLI